MAAASTQDGDGLKVINAGLFRMATKSMATAYKILGYKTHHGLLEGVLDTPWNLIEQAAEATWPYVPNARRRPPNERPDWDAIWGQYDVVTDLASPFALELIKAYPNAKVVVVQRDFDSWWPSFKSELLDTLWRPTTSIIAFFSSNILGVRGVQAMKKVHFGFFKANSEPEIIAHARETYETYFQQLREAVPPERRLVYKMGSGWEPLCQFLGVEVPDVEFPRVNDRNAHQQETGSRMRTFYFSAAKAVIPWIIGGAAVVLAYRTFAIRVR